MSEDRPAGGHKTIFELFGDVKREIGAVGKDSVNMQQKFKFRGIDAVVNAVAPALDRHGVIVIPELKDITYSTVEVGQNRTRMAHVQVKVTYTFWGPSGDSIPPVTVPGEAMDSGDKGTAKAMSVAYRIALLQALNLPTDDVDPDADAYERSPRGEAVSDPIPPPWQPRQERTAANGNGHNGNGARNAARQAPAQAGQSEDGWVREFLGRLADADADVVKKMRIEVARASSTEKLIGAATAKEMFAQINKRVNELDGQAAA